MLNLRMEGTPEFDRMLHEKIVTKTAADGSAVGVLYNRRVKLFRPYPGTGYGQLDLGRFVFLFPMPLIFPVLRTPVVRIPPIERYMIEGEKCYFNC